MFVWCIFVQAEPLCDEESAEEAGSETSDDDENEVEGQGDGEESEGSGDDGASDVSHGSGIDDGEETKVKVGRQWVPMMGTPGPWEPMNTWTRLPPNLTLSSLTLSSPLDM